jgi:hypothetical protein
MTVLYDSIPSLCYNLLCCYMKTLTLPFYQFHDKEVENAFETLAIFTM